MGVLTVLGLTIAGGLALQPVRAPEENPQPLLQRAAVLRQAVARDPQNAQLLLQLARAEYRMAKMTAVRDYSARYPDGISPEPLAVARARYEAWLRGSLYASPDGRRAQARARKAAACATSAALRAEALLTYGTIAWERGQEAEAVRAFRAACRARPDWSAAWIRLAAAASVRGDAATFARARRRVEQLAPDPSDQVPVELFSLGQPPVPGAGGGVPGSLPSSRPGTGTRPDPSDGS